MELLAFFCGIMISIFLIYSLSGLQFLHEQGSKRARLFKQNTLWPREGLVCDVAKLEILSPPSEHWGRWKGGLSHCPVLLILTTSVERGYLLFMSLQGNFLQRLMVSSWFPFPLSHSLGLWCRQELLRRFTAFGPAGLEILSTRLGGNLKN